MTVVYAFRGHRWRARPERGARPVHLAACPCWRASETTHAVREDAAGALVRFPGQQVVTVPAWRRWLAL